tara:strand:- start:200 stop:655 length:456 start_codon:yes stop_codon:yes gene_type:complete
VKSLEYEHDGVSDHESTEKQLNYYIEEFKSQTNFIKKNIIKNVINLIKNEDDISVSINLLLVNFQDTIKVFLENPTDPDISDISKLYSDLNSLIQEKNDKNKNKFSDFHTKFVSTSTWPVNNWSASVLKDYTESKVNIPTYLSTFDESYMY